MTPKSLVIAAAAINSAAQINLPTDVVITSGTDGVHMSGSKHYKGEALDLRLPPIEWRGRFIARLGERLGPDYQIVVEDDHIHVEFDPQDVV